MELPSPIETYTRVSRALLEQDKQSYSTVVTPTERFAMLTQADLELPHMGVDMVGVLQAKEEIKVVVVGHSALIEREMDISKTHAMSCMIFCIEQHVWLLLGKMVRV